MAHQNGSMNNPIRAKAEVLRKNGQFKEAAVEYAQVWPDGDIWTGWGYAYCLRKIGQLQQALEIIREVYRLNSDFQYGKSIYAWILYDLHIKNAETTDQTFLKAADAVVSLTDDQAYEATSAYVITILHVAKVWADVPRDLRVLEWLNKLDVNCLSAEPGKSTDEQGRQRELASKKEQYYSLLTHSLERLGHWQECLDVASRAMTDCAVLHHDNDIWFARRIALAKQRLGRPQEALTELERLVERKQTSFLHTDVAAAAWDSGDDARTFKHSLQALASHQDIGFKLEAAKLLALALWKRGEQENARNHLRLCLAVRSAKGWKVSEELSALASEWEIREWPQAPEVLLDQLRAMWKTWAERLTPRLTGVVTRILPGGHAGFIKGDDNTNFYFETREWKERKAKLAEGIPVTFATKPGFDRKRQCSTTMACEVRHVS